jgi:1-acyl-sn-glycerol-3-phosphate acyltransferase
LIERILSKLFLKSKKLGDYIEANNDQQLFFQRGTESKTGQPKAFSQTGFKILCKAAPSAYVVPVSNNSWKMVKFFSSWFGNHLTFTTT